MSYQNLQNGGGFYGSTGGGPGGSAGARNFAQNYGYDGNNNYGDIEDNDYSGGGSNMKSVYRNDNKKESKDCCKCLLTHDQKYGQNYIWLDVLGHGSVRVVYFEEPVSSGDFKLYDSKWWKTHCKAVSHGEDLYEAHVKAFVNKDTRFA